MFLWNGNLSADREAEKYVHSLRECTAARIESFQLCCAFDGMWADHDRHKLWERSR